MTPAKMSREELVRDLDTLAGPSDVVVPSVLVCRILAHFDAMEAELREARKEHAAVMAEREEDWTKLMAEEHERLNNAETERGELQRKLDAATKALAQAQPFIGFLPFGPSEDLVAAQRAVAAFLDADKPNESKLRAEGRLSAELGASSSGRTTSLPGAIDTREGEEAGSSPAVRQGEATDHRDAVKLRPSAHQSQPLERQCPCNGSVYVRMDGCFCTLCGARVPDRAEDDTAKGDEELRATAPEMACAANSKSVCAEDVATPEAHQSPPTKDEIDGYRQIPHGLEPEEVERLILAIDVRDEQLARKDAALREASVLLAGVEKSLRWMAGQKNTLNHAVVIDGALKNTRELAAILTSTGEVGGE